MVIAIRYNKIVFLFDFFYLFREDLMLDFVLILLENVYKMCIEEDTITFALRLPWLLFTKIGLY